METKLKIINRNDLNDIIEGWKKSGDKIVFTNGCFDILHLGHVDYLEKANGLGDKLVVGLNSDESVRRLKGPERPVNTENARTRILASLQFVDAVVVFDEDTPESLIRQVNPDILVKGNDYKKENIVGSKFVMDNGGKVITLDLVTGYSTTELINKIKEIN